MGPGLGRLWPVLAVASACAGMSETKPKAEAARGGSAGHAAGSSGAPLGAGRPAAGGVGRGGRSAGGTTAGGASGAFSGGVGVGGEAEESGGASGEAGHDPGAAGAAGASGPAWCDVEVEATLSEAIATVATLRWSVGRDLTEARIDFGLDTDYGMVAPVDSNDPQHETLLLGMKPNHTYHYRVAARADGTWCYGGDRTIHTGSLLNGLPSPAIVTGSPSSLAGGFLLGEFYTPASVVFIMDADGDYVWAFDTELAHSDRARTSYDGKWMWVVDTNVPAGSAGGHMLKISMDGTVVSDKSAKFPNIEQDFVVMPDESIYYLAWNDSSGSSAGAKVVRYDPDGTSEDVLNLAPLFGVGGNCPALQYSAEDDTLLVTEVSHQALIKLTRDGDVVWVLGGGTENDFTGDGAVFANTRFNVEALGKDRLLMFDNGSNSSGMSSRAVEVLLDTDQMIATEGASYVPDPPLYDVIFGDVQRLPNENTLVTFSTLGVIHEVNADQELVQSISVGADHPLGYVIKTPTLYDPLPK